MSYDFILNKSFWETNFAPKIKDLTDNFITELKNDPNYISYREAQDNYDESLKKYELEHNSILYFLVCLGLFFSFILIIPFYWNWKTFQKLRQNRDELLANIDNLAKVCVAKTNEFAKNISLTNYIKSINALTKLQRIGPITTELANEINQWSLFNLNYDEKINPHTTSWCVWDNNKIVIEHSSQTRVWTEKTYSGSITIPYTIHTSNGPVVRYRIITEYYTHPYVVIQSKNIKHYAFLQSCEALEFKYLEERMVKTRFSHDKARLENDEFDARFKWEYNNEAQFRMIFTPHKQEMFLNEYHLNSNCVSDADALNKTSLFLHNNYHNCEQHYEWWLSYDLNKIITKFIDDPNLDFKWLTAEIHDCVKNYVYKLFESTKHLWTTPIMYSENHKNIINKVSSQNYCHYYPYYILTNVIKLPIIKKDTNCFNLLVSNDVCASTPIFRIYSSKFIGTSYSYVSKVKKVGMVSIDYIDCVPSQKDFNFYYIQIKYPNVNEHKNVQTKVDELIKAHNIKIYLDDNFIVIVPNQDVLLSAVQQWFNEIYDALYGSKAMQAGLIHV